MKAVKMPAQPVKNVPPIDLTVRNLGLSGIAISPRRRLCDLMRLILSLPP
jgi:hypothetical protein